MKKTTSVYAILGLLIIALSSCQAIGTIFKAGMWWGIILVILVIAVIGWIIAKLGGKK